MGASAAVPQEEVAFPSASQHKHPERWEPKSIFKIQPRVQKTHPRKDPQSTRPHFGASKPPSHPPSSINSSADRIKLYPPIKYSVCAQEYFSPFFPRCRHSKARGPRWKAGDFFWGGNADLLSKGYDMGYPKPKAHLSPPCQGKSNFWFSFSGPGKSTPGSSIASLGDAIWKYSILYIYTFLKPPFTKIWCYLTWKSLLLTQKSPFLGEVAPKSKSSSPWGRRKGLGTLSAIRLHIHRWEFVPSEGHVRDSQSHQRFGRVTYLVK